MKATYWMFAGLGILTAVAIFVLATPAAAAWYTGTQCPASGDWNVSSSTKYYDDNLNVNGNIFVTSDLTLTNCAIRMNTASNDGGVTIDVASGASLTVYNTFITSNNGAYHYKFTVYGSMWINQSSISEVWGDTGSWMGGIQLYSSSVWIGNSSIYDGETGGISISGCSPWIYNNDIYRNGQDGASSTYAYGIYAQGDGTTKMNITTNRIYRNTYDSGGTDYYGYGIRAEYLNNNDAIYGNNIYDNGHLNYANYTYGYQLYLYYSTPTITNNDLSNGQYQLYCEYSNPPTINGGTISGFASYDSYCYGVYAYYSGLTFANATFTASIAEYPLYGIYASSDSPINVTDCTFDYRTYGSYDTYDIYLSSNSPLKAVRCEFYNDGYSTMYAILANSNSDLAITDCNFHANYGYYYGIYAYSNCKVDLTRSSMYSMNTDSTYLIQIQSSSPLRLEGCTLDIEYSFYGARLVEANYDSPVYMNDTILYMYYCNHNRYDYEMSAIRTYSASPVTISNVTATFDGIGGYYWYMFYLDSADLTVNDTKITDANGNIYYYYYMFYTGYSSGNLIIDNVTVDFSASLLYQYGGVYITQGYNYGSSAKLWANRFTVTATVNGYFYGLYWGYGSIYVNNSNFDIRASGEGFYFTQAWYGDFEFRNTVVNAVTQRVQYGSILQDYTYNAVNRFIVDNCTIYYETSNTAGSQGGVGIFQQLDNMECDITNSNVTVVNTDGVVSFQAFWIFNPSRLDVVNCTFKSVLGRGTSASTTLVQWGWFSGTPLVNFTRCNITFELVDQAMILDTFYFEQSCGDLNLDNTTIDWFIDAAGSTVGMVTMSEDTYSAGSLNLMSFKNSRLNMVVDEPDCRVSLLKITPATKIGEFRVAASQVDLEYLVASGTPTTAILISGSDAVISDLKLNLKAPAATQTEIIGLSAEGGSPTFRNIVLHGNGNGRLTGISCSLASTPTIDGCRIDGVYTGIAGDFFAMPLINNTTVDNCNVAISMQNLCNGTVTGSTIKGKLSVQLGQSARVNMYETAISGSVRDWELDGSSTVWLLDCDFKPATSAAFIDTGSRLVVNWYLQLRVQWQNGREIPGAAVVMRNAAGSETLRTVTDEQGVVPWFIVAEYVQTQAAKTMYSPYTVNVTSGGVSGEQAVTTDKTKEQIITVRDDLVPLVVITEPEAEIIQNYVAVTMLGTAADVGSGLDYLMISYDGATWTRAKALPVWVQALDVPEGTRTLTVKLYDRAGNEGVATREIIIDLTKPFIRVDAPADESLGNVIGVDLAGGVEPGSVLTINFRKAILSADGMFTYPVRLVEGRNDFVLFATDRAGNTNTTTWTLHLDISPPRLTVISPVDGFLTNQPGVTVSGMTEAGASVTVNDKDVETNPDGTFSTVLDLRAGPNFVTVAASDAAGNRFTVLRSVVLDNELRLAITAPADRMVTTQVTILVIGITDTDALVRLNGGVVSVDPDGNFSVTFTLDEGWNTLVFSATDRAGNGMSVNRTVLLDTVAPVVELGSPPDGAMLRNRDVAVNGICEPGITLTVNGQPVDTATGVFNATVNLPEGASRITVEGRDAAGNLVTLDVAVTVDLTAPSLSIIEPSTGFRTTDRSVLVVGLTEPGAKVVVNDVPALVDAFGRFTVQLTLAKGSNAVTATSTDASGNTATEKLTVKVVDRPAAYEAGTWWWAAIGLLLALGIMIPLTMYMVNSWQRARIEKEGSK